MTTKVSEKFSKPMDMRKLNRSVEWRLSAASRRADDAKRFSQKTVPAVCPVCAKNENTPLVTIYDFAYVTCKNCTHVYVKNVPSKESLKAFYEKKLAGVSMRPSEDLVQKDLYVTRVKDISIPKVKHITQSLKKKGTWVDIGCGSGELLYAAKKLGWKTIGYEIDPDERHLAKDIFGLDVRSGYLEKSNAAEILQEANVISFFSVLEHVPQPSELLALVNQFAKKDAALVLELPHHPSLSAWTNMAFPDTVARHMLPPNHLSLFTDESVKYLLEKNGFEITHIWYYGQDFYELIGTVAALSPMKERDILNKLLDATGEFQKIIDKNKLSDEMIVIARRSKTKDQRQKTRD